MYKHTSDNHESPEKRRRAEVSSSSQQPLAKTANKHGITNTPTKTNSTVGTGPAQPPPSSSITPSTTPSATQASKGTSTLGKATTEPQAESAVDSSFETGDVSSLKAPQVSPFLSSTHRESCLANGNKEPLPDSLSSGDHIPRIDDKHVMLPPKQTDKDAIEGAIGDRGTYLDDNLWTGVDVPENVYKRKGSVGDPPKNKVVKLTALVSLDCGPVDEDAKVLVKIAKKGLNTRFEVIQGESES